MKRLIPILMIIPVCLLSISASYTGSKCVENEAKSVDKNYMDEKKKLIKKLLSCEDCDWEGIKLCGKVQFVTSFPDIKIQYVTSFPDIKVKFVDAFPDDCGEWQEVSSFPDFKVQIVNSFPDLKVQKVTSFPGMN